MTNNPQQPTTQERARAQNALGEMYLYGKGVEKDQKKAASWFKKAVRHKNPDAQNHLGVMYAENDALEQAEQLFKAADEKKLDVAQYNLGLKYAKGDTVHFFRDLFEKQVEKRLIAAADQGFADAQYLLGLIKEGGDLKDKLKDEKFLHHATAQKKSENDKVLIGGGSVNVNTSVYNATQQVVISSDDPLKWYTDAAEQGHFKARQKIREFAKKGDPMAQYYLGRLYEYGIGLEKSKESAVKWYTKSANQGNAHAQFSLGMMYARGEGVPEDMERVDRLIEAFEWCERAADQGHANANFSLGQMYYRGEGVGRNLGEARTRFSAAATAAETGKDEKTLKYSLMAEEQIEEDFTP